LFEEFQNSFDPASATTAQAEAEFNRRVKQLYEERVTVIIMQYRFCYLKEFCRGLC